MISGWKGNEEQKEAKMLFKQIFTDEELMDNTFKKNYSNKKKTTLN